MCLLEVDLKMFFPAKIAQNKCSNNWIWCVIFLCQCIFTVPWEAYILRNCQMAPPFSSSRPPPQLNSHKNESLLSSCQLVEKESLIYLKAYQLPYVQKWNLFLPSPCQLAKPTPFPVYKAPSHISAIPRNCIWRIERIIRIFLEQKARPWS